MSKKTDDSIEKFFRKAVSRYDTRFRESDWQKMEQMLDAQSSLKNNGNSFRVIKRAAFGLAALVMISGAVYLFTLNKEHSSENKLSASNDRPLREMQAAAEQKAPADEGNEKKSTAGLLSSETSSEKKETPDQNHSEQHQLENDNTPVISQTRKTAPRGSETEQLPSSGKRQTRTQKVPENNATPDQPDPSVKNGSVLPATENSTTQNGKRSVIQKPEPGKTVISNTEASRNQAQRDVKDNNALSQAGTSIKTASVPPDLSANNSTQTDNKSAIQKSEDGKTILSDADPGKNVAVTTRPGSDTQVKEVSGSSEIAGNKIVQSDIESAIQKSEPAKIIVPHKDTGDKNREVMASRVINNNEPDKRDAPLKAGSLSSAIDENTSDQNGDDAGGQKQKSEEAIIVNVEKKDNSISVRSNGDKSLADAVADAAIPEKDSLNIPDKKDEKATDTEKEIAKEEKPELKTQSKWSVFLSLAPDFSSTGLRQFSAPGSAYGFQIGYQLFPKISLHTGLIRSSKKYKSDGADYHPPKGYWGYRTNGVVPDEIKGQCAVWEIPLWIQVDIRQRERSRYYVSAGASGYLMTSQSYDYSFNTENPGAAKGWSSSEDDSYPLAVGHLSAGYERNITPAVGLGIEPFVKIPFGGMGWSKVNLFTTGFYVNVRYRFLKRVPPM